MPVDEEMPANVITAAANAVVNAAEKLQPFLLRVFGPALEGYGEAWGENARLYRIKNSLLVAEKFGKLAAERGLDANSRKIALRHLNPLLEGISQEDDDAIQEFWARLIANSCDPLRRQNLNKQYIDSIKAFDPIDAMVLNLLRKNVPSGTEPIILSHEDVCKELGIELDDLHASIFNLRRLNCLEISTHDVLTTGESKALSVPQVTIETPTLDAELTFFGVALLEATKN